MIEPAVPQRRQMTDVRTDGQRKRVFIRTYGCQMNVYDSDRMADVLRPLGYALADDARAGRPGRAQHLPHPREGLGEGLFRARPPARRSSASAAPKAATSPSPSPAASPRPRARRSCAARPPSTSWSARRPITACPSCWPRPSARPPIRRAGKRLPGAGVLDTEFPAESKFDHLPAPQGVRAGSAFLSIQEGCDKFCTFCVVPYTRGAEYSRPAAAVLAEARAAGRGRRARDHAARPERQRLSRRGAQDGVDLVAGAADPRAGRDRWPGAHPLHDLPSARHGRRSDRRARRRCRSSCRTCICRCSRARTASSRR